MNKLSLASLIVASFFVFFGICLAELSLYYPFESKNVVITQYPDDDYAAKNNLHTYPGHTGTDFKLKFGEPIYASASGSIIEVVDGLGDGCEAADWKLTRSYYGNHVTIKTDDGDTMIYGHLKKGSVISNNVKTISVGENIGEAGSSGNTQGSDECGTFIHLHFELKNQNGAMVNPYAQDLWVKGQKGEILTVDQFINNVPANKEVEIKPFTAACDNNSVKGLIGYLADVWSFAKPSSDEFVDGTFTNKNGCKVDVWLGIQGSFCAAGEAKETGCSEKAESFTINGNKVDRLSAVKGKAFYADYYIHTDDKSCCNSAGCGYDFDFQMSASDEETGKKCMADFEELLKNFRLKDVESSTMVTPVKNKPVAEEPSVSNQPPSEAEINLAKSRGDITASITTNKGTIKLQLYGGKTPVTVANFVKLAQSGFYNGLKFHRVIKDFMIQGGDPFTKDDSKQKLWGTGGPGYKLNDEPFSGEYVRGTLAMGSSGPNTNGSQFFIMQKDYPLARSSVIFGKVTEGMDVVDVIANVKTDSSDHPLEPVVISDIKIN
jgi:cyclophilin family peptidyl-prolyl cis-trans isomerase